MSIDPLARAILRSRQETYRTQLRNTAARWRGWTRFSLLASLLLGLLTLSACLGAPPMDSRVAPRPLGRDLATASRSDILRPEAPAFNAAPATSGVRVAAVTGPLTLVRALSTALLNNPELTAVGWELRAADARVLQASLRPNPELGLEAENFAGSGPFSGLSAVEYTALISQPILTGGEVAKRTRIARLERKLAAWGYEAKRLDVFTQVAQRYIGVLAAQRQRAVAQQAFDLAQQFHQTVARQVAAGAVSPIRQSRAAAERAREQVNLRRAERALQAARIALAEPLGLAEPTFDKVVGELGAVRPVPPLEVLDTFVAQNPAIARWKTVLAQRKAAIELAQAEGIPDVTLGVGVRHFRALDDNAAVASLSVPLPIFDRNQGNIAAARAELSAARRQRQAAIIRVRTALGQRYQELQAAREAAAGLARKALPAARSAYEAIRTAYRYGHRGFLDVLIAQRTLFDVKARYIEALANYHRTAVAVERLIVRPLNGIATDDAADPATSEQGNTP